MEQERGSGCLSGIRGDSVSAPRRSAQRAVGAPSDTASLLSPHSLLLARDVWCSVASAYGHSPGGLSAAWLLSGLPGRMWSGHCRPLVLAGRSSAPGHLAGRRCPRHQTCVALFESGAEPQTNWSFTASCMATRAKAGPPAEGDPPLAALCSEGGVGAGGARGLSSHLTAPDCVGPPRFNSGTVYPLQASPPPSRCRSACTVPPTGQHFTHAPVTPCRDPPPAPRLPAPRPRACPAAPALPSPSGPLPFQGPFLPAERPGPGPRCARHYCPCAVTTPLLGGADAGVSPRHRGTPLTVPRPPPPWDGLRRHREEGRRSTPSGGGSDRNRA